MNLPNHLLTSFKAAWRADLGYDLSNSEANTRALAMLDLVMALAGHPTSMRPLERSNNGRENTETT